MLSEVCFISCKGMVTGYDRLPVAGPIDMEVKKGDYLYIVGENGAGKSTLMKTLLRLIEPVSGSITYGEAIRHTGIGYLSQQTDIQRDFPATVEEIVYSGNLVLSDRRFFYSHKDRERAEKNMETMDILKLRKRSYRDLSGGQQQRVLLARALCASTEILLLDEPVSGLDPRVTMELYQLLQKMHENGMTIIMISHDIQAALQYATHILHMDKEHSFIGTKEEYLQSDEYRFFQRSQNREHGKEQKDE